MEKIIIVIEEYREKLRNENIGTSKRACYMKFIERLEGILAEYEKEKELEEEMMERMGWK
ncbi:MAG: hypothetical protein ACRCXX_07200 [Cetobacterium sp.]|uniref:hypothetical protein n=1 Tax=Cetobacterium sp. TaxID=2071632 RepID=UPI003F38AF84